MPSRIYYTMTRILLDPTQEELQAYHHHLESEERAAAAATTVASTCDIT